MNRLPAPSPHHPQAGYSLIEISVVLVLIGLIMGGVMKGRALVDNARTKALVSQIQNYRTAHTLFQESYSALPGDCADARTLLGAALVNGDNDGIIMGEPFTAGTQAQQYWQHLVAAGLIPALPQEATAAPATKIGGFITVAYQPADGMEGHWFVVGAKSGAQGNGALLTPQQAALLDKSFDNGDPQSGDIQFRGATGSECLTANGAYNLENKRPACVAYFKM